jgi:hypothetical protein
MLKTSYDEVWIVYDLEKPNDERRRLSKNVENQARNELKVHFALSDPSFEFWYILHYTKTTKSFTGADEVERYLKQYWKNYVKNSEPTLEIVDKTNDAIKNAQWVRKHLRSTQSNAPMTNIDQIVIKLKEYKHC